MEKRVKAWAIVTERGEVIQVYFHKDKDSQQDIEFIKGLRVRPATLIYHDYEDEPTFIVSHNEDLGINNL